MLAPDEPPPAITRRVSIPRYRAFIRSQRMVALAILDAALRRRVMDAFNAVLGCGSDQAARGKIFRRGRELRGTAGRATAGKKEDDRRPTIARVPLWRKIEVDPQITLRRGLIH